jgi:hypothetical protein
MKRMSNFSVKMVESSNKPKDSQSQSNDEYLLDEDDEEEKEFVEINFTKFSKKQKTDVLRRPRLFILPNADKLKDMIKESLNTVLMPKTNPGSPISYPTLFS